MKEETINIAGNDYGPLLVGWSECCMNCDIPLEHCHMQCHYFEDDEKECVAMKKIHHTPPETIWMRIKRKYFQPIESDYDLPF